ncbi:hypothetical protein QCA50_006262 [Cerrena zonata]|uniref:F-box domain-containing protein n=1 Tax=Cerrena zonata TaxID=2478898 RepID=A0AAW0GJ25_9APHY
METGTDALLDNIQARMVTILKMKQTYETAIAQEESALAQDRRLLNSFQPIGKIPMDVLLIIFMFYIQDTLPENAKRRNPFNIVRLTHVCSRWRVVATETATLWTFIDLGWPAWTIALIPRSVLAPLSVVFSSYSPVENYPTKSLTKYIFKHHPRRIASLKISAPHNIFTWLDIFIPLFLPSLRVLQLVCAYGEASTPRFAGNLPTNLQYFRLMGNLKWKIESPPLLSHSTLETLSLRLNTPDSRLQMGDILRALDNMPLLKQLHLHTAFSTLWSTSLPSIVQLPYLTRLSIVGQCFELCCFP